jgi:hypothetical protein
VLVRARQSWCIAVQNKRESLRDAAQITRLSCVLTCLLALTHGHLSWMPADIRHNAQLITLRTDTGLGLFRGKVTRRWEEDQTFNDVKVNRIESAEVIDGVWYLIIKGDYTGRVTGTVYDLTSPTDPQSIELTPTWEKCKLPDSDTQSTSRKVCFIHFHKSVLIAHTICSCCLTHGASRSCLTPMMDGLLA